MINYGQHWVCASCAVDQGAGIPDRGDKIKVLNLYAGVGGNRFLWPGILDVTAVEINPQVAAEYKTNFPGDNLVIADAHKYLLNNYKKFDIIWSSPPCQTHTKMNYIQEKKRYADMSLYQEIILLHSFFSGKYIVENVRPYYEPLMPAQFDICRHLFWTNVPELTDIKLPAFPPEYQGRHKGINIMPKKVICDWLGMPAGQKNIYLTGKSSEQVYRNCVHPLLGQSIMNDVLNSMTGGNQPIAEKCDENLQISF